MKRTSKYLFSAVLSGLVCFALAQPASAQHRDGGGSSGGGSHSSGSSGGGSSYHSSGSSSSFSAPRSAPQTSSSFRGNMSQPSRGNVGTYSQQRGVGIYSPQRGNVAPRNGMQSYRGFVPPNGSAARSYSSPRYGTSAARPYVQGDIPSYRYGNRGIGGHFGNGYYHGGGYWPSHGYYHYYHGYYNSYYAPRLGFSIGFLPYGYYPFWYGDYQYYYSDGLFYQYNDNQYTVVEPPVGAQVNELPKNAQSIVINGQQYYEANGVYYQQITKDDGSVVYEVAGKDGQLNTNDQNDNFAPQGPQIGDVVTDLPQDTRRIKLNGEKFYVTPDGYYYQDYTDQNGNHAYKLVGTPQDEPEDQQ